MSADREISNTVSAILDEVEEMLASEMQEPSRSRSARARRQILRLMAYNFLRCEEFLAAKGQLGSQDLITIEGMVWPVIGDLFRHGSLRNTSMADNCLKLMNLVRNVAHG